MISRRRRQAVDRIARFAVLCYAACSSSNRLRRFAFAAKAIAGAADVRKKAEDTRYGAESAGRGAGETRAHTQRQPVAGRSEERWQG